MQALTLLVILAFLHIADGQRRTFGRDFRLVFLDNTVENPVGRAVDLYVCNRVNQPVTTVNITLPYFNNANCPSQTIRTVNPDSCSRISLCSELRHTYSDGTLSNKVVDVTANYDVSVQGLNVEKFSADSFVVLPWSQAGLIHQVLTYVPSLLQTQFAIVTKENTKVRITIPDRAGETITVDYNGLRYSNGDTFQFNLSPSTSYLAQSSGDLSGVIVQSDKPIAVFSGNVRTHNDAARRTSRDHLVEQVPSTSRWGSSFIYVPTPRAVLGDTIKIITKQGNTVVDLISDVTRTVTLPTVGSVLELELTKQTHIKTRGGKILVGVIVHSQEGPEMGATDPNDPALYILPAVEQYDNEYYMPAFMDSENKPYTKVVALVAVPENSVAGLALNGVAFGPNQTLLSKPTSAGALPYRAGVITLNGAVSNRISHLQSAGIMVVGYGATDRESFASSLGYSFTSTCVETIMGVNDKIDNDCDGLVDEEIPNNSIDDDNDGLLDEDASGTVDATGSSFAIVFMSNIVKDSAISIDQIEFYVVALENNTLVNVTAPAYTGPSGPSIINLAATLNSVVQIQLNPIMRIGNDAADLGVSKISNNGIRVDSNKNIVLYGINKKQFSTDSFLALPTNNVGFNYYATCYHPINLIDDRCQFAVVALTDNTVVHIELRSGVVTEPLNGKVYTGPTTFNVSLNAYQVLEIQSANDLTGTRVFTTDNTRFSFFSGNVRTRITVERASRDHLVEQIPSVDTFGTDFSAIATPREADLGDVFQIVAGEPDTTVTYHYLSSSSQLPTSHSFNLAKAGDYSNIALGYGSPMSIKANKPILAVQFSQSATNRDTDPTSMLLIPENQWGNNFRFVTPLSGQVDTNTNQQIPFDNYLLIITDGSQRQGMRYTNPQGQVINLGTVAGWVPIPGTTNEGLVYRIPHGQSFISNANGNAKFSALAFGKADRETYGNAVGLRLSRRGCEPTANVNGDQADNDCDGQKDEEIQNGIDDDFDGLVDEDCALMPTGYKYFLVFQENVVEFTRNFALEVFIGNHNNNPINCRLETPLASPNYDEITAIPAGGANHFALSPSLRAVGVGPQFKTVMVTCDGPATVLGLNKETYSADAFLAYESRTIGTDYYTVSYAPSNLPTQFAVAATEGSATVTMSFSAPVLYRGQNLTSLTINLRQYEVFQAQSDLDLTGSRVQSTAPVAVYSGNVRTKVVLSASRDHLASQLPPTPAWGLEHMIVPLHFRTVGDIYRVVASSPNTRVLFNGTTYDLPQAGSFVQLDVASSTAGRLTADKPVMVMQIMKSQVAPHAAETADPCFILSVPTNQYVDKAVLVTPLFYEGLAVAGTDYQNTVTIITPTGTSAGIRLNGKTVAEAGSTLIGVRSLPSTIYEAADIRLNQGGLRSFTVTNANPAVKFSGYQVGIADRESYCTTIGINLPVR